MAGEGHIWVSRLKPRAPIVFNTEHVQFINVSKAEVHNGRCTVAQCKISFSYNCISLCDQYLAYACLLAMGSLPPFQVTMATVNFQDFYALKSILSLSECSANKGSSNWPHPLNMPVKHACVLSWSIFSWAHLVLSVLHYYPRFSSCGDIHVHVSTYA